MSLLQQPAVAGERILERGGERMFGREPVVDAEDASPGGLGKPPAEFTHDTWRAGYVAAAVHVQDRAFRCGLDRGQPLRRNAVAVHGVDADAFGYREHAHEAVHDLPDAADLARSRGELVRPRVDGFEERLQFGAAFFKHGWRPLPPRNPGAGCSLRSRRWRPKSRGRPPARAASISAGARGVSRCSCRCPDTPAVAGRRQPGEEAGEVLRRLRIVDRERRHDTQFVAPFRMEESDQADVREPLRKRVHRLDARGARIGAYVETHGQFGHVAQPRSPRYIRVECGATERRQGPGAPVRPEDAAQHVRRRPGADPEDADLPQAGVFLEVPDAREEVLRRAVVPEPGRREIQLEGLGGAGSRPRTPVYARQPLVDPEVVRDHFGRGGVRPPRAEPVGREALSGVLDGGADDLRVQEEGVGIRVGHVGTGRRPGASAAENRTGVLPGGRAKREHRDR